MPRKKAGRGKLSIGARRKTGRKQAVESLPGPLCCSENISFEPYSSFFSPDNTCEAVSYSSGNEIQDYEGSFADEFFLVADKVIQLSPSEDSDTLFMKRMVTPTRYRALKTSLMEQALSLQTETGFFMLKSSIIKFVQIYDSDNPGVKSAVTIDPETFRAHIIVHRQTLCETHPLWTYVPEIFYSSENITRLLKCVAELGVCVGNPDFVHIQPGLTSFFEQDFGAVCGTLSYDKTIRHVQCELLVSGIRCSKCMCHRAALRKRKSMENKKLTASDTQINLFSNRTPHSKMSKEQLSDKVKALQKERYAISAELCSLRRKLQQAIETSNRLSEKTTGDIHVMTQECTDQVKMDFPDENSFERLFWEEQVKYNRHRKPSSMRWHPMIIKWCLQIKGRSTKAYETLRNIGFVKLPSTRTLYNYSHVLQTKCGIAVDTENHLMDECKAKGMLDTEWKSYVGLLQDEMKIKQDLVYDKHSGELVGFVDLDKTGNQLSELEQGLSDEKHQLATSMLVVMVRGIATDLKYPLACYATDSVTADFLYPILYRCIRTLEYHIGLKVMFVTCDGASSNRKFFSMHGSSTTYCTPNPYDLDRNIFFISDVPHLIKTCRNCFSNSYSHNKTRKLWNSGKSISWMHVVDLYNNDVKKGIYSHCPKLTRQHIDLDAHSKMNVSLAAQVLSSTVANALEHLYGEDVQGTVKFIRYMNKFFDCMNTRNLKEGHKKRNPNLHPYVSGDDERLKWLQHDFLSYFRNWEQSVELRTGQFTPKDKSAMQLSHQTINGLQMTVMSVVELVKYLLAHGVPFVLTSVFNQDPLEQQFGHCRHMGGSQDNPRAHDVRHAINRLRVMGSTALALSGGNTKHGPVVQTVDSTPMPKRLEKQ